MYHLIMKQKTTRQTYLDKGFVCLRKFLDAREIAICQEKIREFIEGLIPQLPRDHVFYEDRETLSTLKQIQQMQDHCPWCERPFDVANGQDGDPNSCKLYGD